MLPRHILGGFLLRIVRRTLLFAALVLAAGIAVGAAQAQQGNRPLEIGLRPVAPYVIQKSDGSLGGLEYELFSAALRAAGLDFHAELVPFGRLSQDFRHGLFDGIAPANRAMELPGCLTRTLLVYRNMAFALASRNLPLQSAADLTGYDVMAFQNAHRILGGAMADVQARNPRYREVANQMLQVRALFSGRTDVAIMDRRIFRNLMHSPESGVDTSAALQEFPLFPPTEYSAAFRDAALCARFDAGLETIRRNGSYDQILRRWDSGPQAQNGATGRPG
ncbi:MAG: substrate-binding periplasmic protein [Ferrovibrio sp.]|uniref:substrate-binding periplasmic protein n=1 Tax=Ferrovibrio sp. TaxID=1917215 RepID=UPI00391A3034